MAPTTLTTIVMVFFAVFVISWAAYNLFGSWQPEPRRVRVSSPPSDADIDRAVVEMRAAIEAYEQGQQRR